MIFERKKKKTEKKDSKEVGRLLGRGEKSDIGEYKQVLYNSEKAGILSDLRFLQRATNIEEGSNSSLCGKGSSDSVCNIAMEFDERWGMALLCMKF